MKNDFDFKPMIIGIILGVLCVSYVVWSYTSNNRIPEMGDSQLIVKSTEARNDNLCIYIIGQDTLKGQIVSKFSIQSHCGVYTPGDRIVITKSIVPRTERIGGKKK